MNESPPASAGSEATPLICEGRSLPLAGALIVLPALAGTGLLDAATRVYDIEGGASCGLRALLLSIVFASLLDEPRPEGLPASTRWTSAASLDSTDRSTSPECDGRYVISLRSGAPTG